MCVTDKLICTSVNVLGLEDSRHGLHVLELVFLGLVLRHLPPLETPLSITLRRIFRLLHCQILVLPQIRPRPVLL